MEPILRRLRQRNVEQHILASETEVIDRLLSRTVEMNDLYEEVSARLNERQQEYLLDAMLGAATNWNPQTSRVLRDQQQELERLNREIEKNATKLASLMRERYELSESSGLSSYPDHHVLQWIERSSERNWLHRSHVREPLQGLERRYDLKYWPRTF